MSEPRCEKGEPEVPPWAEPPRTDDRTWYERSMPANPWLRYPLAFLWLLIILPFAIVVALAHYVLGQVVNLGFLLVAIVVLIVVGRLSVEYLSPGWIFLTLPLTVLSMVPAMKLLVRMNKKLSFD